MKKYVLGFLFSDDGVLLIHKRSGRFQGKHNGLGGSIQEGETPLAAICREVEEESKIDTAPSEWVPVATMFDTDYALWVFAALIPYVWDPVSSDEGEVAFYDVKHLPPTLDPTARWMLALCSDTTIAGPVTIRTNSPQQFEDQQVLEGSHEPKSVNAIEGNFANIITTVFGASDGDTVIVPDNYFRAVMNLLIRYEGPDVLLMSQSDRTNEVRQKYPQGRV